MMTSFRWVHDLSPFLFHTQILGQTVGVRWYGLAYVFGLFCAFLTFRRAAMHGDLPGFGAESQSKLIMAATLGVVGGGRLGYVLQHPAELLADPLFALRAWEGGMTFFGGLLGVIAAMIWTARRERISFWRLADVATFPAAFGLGVGRIANFVNGELWGRPTGGDWGVVFPNVDGLPRHPSQLYEAVSHFLLLGILLWVWRRFSAWRRQQPGNLAALFLLGYGLLRFLTDFYRDDDTYIGPFSSGQWASLVVAFAGAALLLILRRASRLNSSPNAHLNANAASVPIQRFEKELT